MERRLFLLNAARASAALAAAGASSVVHAAPSNAAGYPFSLGVASGAPLHDSVILWTRILADPLDAHARAPLYMFLEITPKETRTRFMGLDEVRDPHSAQRELAAFRVVDGKAGVET